MVSYDLQSSWCCKRWVDLAYDRKTREKDVLGFGRDVCLSLPKEVSCTSIRHGYVRPKTHTRDPRGCDRWRPFLKHVVCRHRSDQVLCSFGSPFGLQNCLVMSESMGGKSGDERERGEMLVDSWKYLLGGCLSR